MSTNILYVIIGALEPVSGTSHLIRLAADAPALGALITELTAFTAGALIFLPVISKGFPKVS